MEFSDIDLVNMPMPDLERRPRSLTDAQKAWAWDELWRVNTYTLDATDLDARNTGRALAIVMVEVEVIATS